MARGNSAALLRRAVAAQAGSTVQLAGRGATVGAGVLARGVATARVAAGGLYQHKCHACGRVACMGHHQAGFATSSSAVGAQPEPVGMEQALSPTERLQAVLDAFPTALSVDDFMTRVEMALAAYGFTGANSIAMSNLCRDESCMIVEEKIESIFGSAFSTHGLGGVLTCGVLGMKAGLSHSPIVEGKERYVFFSFPHIAIDSNGKVGAISRPNRPGGSAACGALLKTLADFKEQGIDAHVAKPGVHDPLDVEFSILKQRLARRLKHEGISEDQLDLVSITKAAERTITTDLEHMISHAGLPADADYAVITGVQIHNWSADVNNDASTPSWEFVAPANVYVVSKGQRTDIDLSKVPALSPRQLQVLASASSAPADAAASIAEAAAISGGIVAVPRDYLWYKMGGGLPSTPGAGTTAQSWMRSARPAGPSFPTAPKMDEH